SESNASCGAGGATCSACPGGTECNKSTGQCACDATSCPHGCCNGNTCGLYASQSASQCGTAGAAGSACSNGLCDTSVGACQCDSTTCPSGCCNGGASGTCAPYASESNTSCGAAGAACAACGSGKECSKTTGTCVCDATSCPSGCCNGGPSG